MAASGLSPSAAIAGIVEAGLNGYLGQDEEVRARLAGMAGRVVAMDLTDLGITLYVCAEADRVLVSTGSEREPDVTLRGTLPVLMRSALDPAGESGLELIGDVGLGQRFQQLLADVEPDWEEKLSSVIGDVAAHQLGRVFRGVLAWGKDTRRTFEANLGELIQEERRDAPSVAEVEHFLDGVGEVRSDLDRLDARIRRLRSQIGSDRE